MGKNNIRFHRLRKAITQVDLAKRIGVSQQAVAKWEKEETEVSLKYVSALSKVLGVKKELIFPELRPAGPDARENVNDEVDLILGYQAVFKFRGRKNAYFAQLDKMTYERLMSKLGDCDFESTQKPYSQIWFDTVDGLSVALNKCRLQWVEFGRDLDEPQHDRIEPQILGANDPDFESEGDDRLVRLFIAGNRLPYMDFPNPEDTHGLLEVMYDAFGDFLDQQEFPSFWWDSGNDMRRVFFRAADFELIEGPKSAMNAYYKRSMEEAGASPEDIAKLDQG